jgi:hypothetical protein
LTTIDHPQYPATDMVINVLVLSLAKIYLEKAQPDPVRVMAVDILGKIAGRCIADTKRNMETVAKSVDEFNASGSEDEEAE